MKNIVPIHVIKKYNGSEGVAPLIPNLVLDGGERLASRLGSFTPRKKNRYPLKPQWIPEPVWTVLEKRK
jgi:hypothetical protein